MIRGPSSLGCNQAACSCPMPYAHTHHVRHLIYHLSCLLCSALGERIASWFMPWRTTVTARRVRGCAARLAGLPAKPLRLAAAGCHPHISISARNGPT